MSNNQTTMLDEQTTNHLNEIENVMESSSVYFKPKPDQDYLIKMDIKKDKIVQVQNDRFKDTKGNPVVRYECKILHVNNGKEQLWDTSKTTCQKIIEQLKKGFTVLKVRRIGTDRSTTYSIDGVQ